MHTVASVIPHLSASSQQEHAYTSPVHCMCSEAENAGLSKPQDSGLYIHHKKKIKDITNAANIGIWHSEHAKKLTLMNCHNGLSFL